MSQRRRPLLFWSFAALVVLLILLGRLSGLLVDALWFGELGFRSLFVRLLTLKVAFGGAAFLVVFGYLGFNLQSALRRALAGGLHREGNVIELFPGAHLRLPPVLLHWGGWLLAALIAGVFMLGAGSQWDTLLRYLWSQPVGSSDPVFGRDLGFYLFELPFLQLLQNSLATLTLLTFAAVLALTLLTGLVRRGGEGFAMPRPAGSRQLTLTFVLFLATFAWGYLLDRYELLYSSTGVVYGAGYTDLHVVRIALWVMLAASLALAIVVVTGLWRKQLRLMIWGVAGYLGLLIIVLLIVPRLVQSFYVEPNELVLETPYLKHEIAFTRQAYGIDRLEVRDYPALADLGSQDLADNQQTLDNIRLWDWRPLLQSFRQLQEIRSYYQFYEVDVDRYRLGGKDRQVMLSARELAPKLPARADTWVNRTLQFTHGYGLAMSRASQQGDDGSPSLLIRDLPPVSPPELAVKQPAIFYGEKMPGYRIVNTGVKELDYPKGDDNVYTSYQGRGGIPLDSFWKKLLLAWQLDDINILISDYLTAGSRLQLHRRVQERIARLAPFLSLDSDPYLVLSDGHLYWIQDAYTTSDRYPYAEPYRGRINYIRNAVKVVVDAYQGTVTFYAMEPEEPILKVYRQALPEMFRPLQEMPADLRRHLRYPENLFRIQVEKYNRYHMTVPQVFYNNEDLWTLPREKYAGNSLPMEPYYILMRLPEEKRLEFLLMQPLTPQNRDNMIGWMAARCDQPDYGRLLVYKLPKEKLIYGPMQIEAMIDQDPVISRQLSLWDQRGSQVIRGNLLVIPLGHSFLYVEPVYLIAEGNNIPQLRRVIVAANDRVAMEPSLAGALAAVFGSSRPSPAQPQPATATEVQPQQLKAARQSLQRAQQALQKGDWQEFGRAMEQLQQQLNAPAEAPGK